MWVPCAQAQEVGKATVQTSVKGKNKISSKKEKRGTTKAGACVYNNKQWSDGAHCTIACNSQGTFCDMRICTKGSWKPYSSCFGPAAVAPNCPASCG